MARQTLKSLAAENAALRDELNTLRMLTTKAAASTKPTFVRRPAPPKDAYQLYLATVKAEAMATGRWAKAMSRDEFTASQH